MVLPSGNLGAQNVNGVHASVQALADHNVEFDLGEVQPATVLGRADELEAVPQHGSRGTGLRHRRSSSTGSVY